MDCDIPFQEDIEAMDTQNDPTFNEGTSTAVFFFSFSPFRLPPYTAVIVVVHKTKKKNCVQRKDNDMENWHGMQLITNVKTCFNCRNRRSGPVRGRIFI